MTTTDRTDTEWLQFWDRGEFWRFEGVCPICLHLWTARTSSPHQGHVLHDCRNCGIVLEPPVRSESRVLRPLPPKPEPPPNSAQRLAAIGLSVPTWAKFDA